ncbi:MAG: PAS domain-containing protein [Flavobacterium sp.]|nr:MAG: PAS domain-containing protein [Flavobacterium sp.]
MNNDQPNHLLAALVTKAIDASVTGIIITDNQLPDNPIIYCNKAFEDMTGYSNQEIIGHNCRFLQAEDRAQPQREQLKHAIAHGEHITVEIRNYRKDGVLFWNELHVSPVFSDDGALTHFIGVQHDITDKKEVQDALIRSKRNMEQQVKERTKVLQNEREFTDSILETVRESLIVLDPQHRVISINQHFLRTFKVSRSDTEQQSLYDLGNGQWNIEQLKVMLEDVLPTNNPVLDFEVTHDFPHIGRKIMLLNAYRIELEGEYKNRILLAIEDITERRSMEVRKDDFLSIASHELKTPLTTVKGYIQMLSRFMPENASEQFRTILEKADYNVERLNNLISELLDMSKIQTGNIELHMEAYDFDAMIAETVDGLQAAHSEHQIKLEGKAGIRVTGDESHIAQVITNLLSNGIKYAPDSRELEVHVSLVSNYVKVSVKDFGMGISIEDQAKIFDKFVQIERKKDDYQGTGLGLSIVKRLIEVFGSEIHLTSKENEGSEFTFTIPFEVDAEKSMEIIRNIEVDLSSGQIFNILVVEDNKINQVVTKKIIESNNYRCHIVDDGFAALELLAKSSFDLILMDINMPGINGFETSRRIRANGINTPIVALTAFEKDEIAEEAISSGMNDIIIKPFEPVKLFRIISGLIGKSKGSGITEL